MVTDCPACQGEIDVDENGTLFGDPIICKHCKAELETDWDYSSEDTVAQWITGKFKPFEGKVDGNTGTSSSVY